MNPWKIAGFILLAWVALALAGAVLWWLLHKLGMRFEKR